ncbi:hypothetical protein, partial [Oleiagrimonas sp. MCCC 1A03011]|uniref:hypothetical protein n=1 Tax=Oleiagrimonas sp. MCCC 1A03011 TaxID=1926883 RepID=UPI00197FBA4A
LERTALTEKPHTRTQPHRFANEYVLSYLQGESIHELLCGCRELDAQYIEATPRVEVEPNVSQASYSMHGTPRRVRGQ